MKFHDGVGLYQGGYDITHISLAMLEYDDLHKCVDQLQLSVSWMSLPTPTRTTTHS